MELIVIPDCHLKPIMFRQASEIMRSQSVSRAVCLMDIADDWGQETNIGLYTDTYDAAIAFAREYPETLWCYGNHDISYMWDRYESGYSAMAQPTVTEKLYELRSVLPEPQQLAFVHRIDDVLFSHGGVSDNYVRRFIPLRYHDDIDRVVSEINCFGPRELWQDSSPLWLRPQLTQEKMYRPRKLLQVVGHTPVRNIIREKNVISCDVFSTYRNREPYGSCEFIIIDTLNREYRCVSP